MVLKDGQRELQRASTPHASRVSRRRRPFASGGAAARGLRRLHSPFCRSRAPRPLSLPRARRTRLLQNAVERERKRQTGWRKYWARAKQACTLPPRVRVAVAWLLMLGIFTGLSMIAVIYSVVFGAETTRLMLFSWCLASAQTFMIEVRRNSLARTRARPRCRLQPRGPDSMMCPFAAHLCAQEPLVIALAILMPWLIDRLTGNELFGELFGNVVQNAVGLCVSTGNFLRARLC
jgi:hypothetical protein